MAISVLNTLDCFLAIIAIFLVRQVLKSKASFPLPPGPKGWPLIGNLFDMPKHHEWVKFAEWGSQYGDIVSLNLAGQPMILLSSNRVATEMLDKKSSIYSDRPVLMMGGEIIGWNKTLVLTPYGERFREYRRLIHRLIGGKSQMERFHGLEELETHKFLARILRSPDEVAAHIRKTAGAIILKMAYGYDVREGSDPIVELVDTAVEQFSLSTTPGAFLVDIFPPLRFIPEWLPGAGWKKTASAWKETLIEMADVPYEFVTSRMKNNTNIPNFTSKLLEHEKLDLQKEFNIKWSAASLYSGGSDTTVSAIYTFFLAMTLFPEAQRKAQAEIDAVVGGDRLPSFADRAQLPYVEALIKEVFRWQPVAPLAPHRVMEDDVHDGFFIPKGALVFANIWQMLHDPKDYPDPFTFNPDRFVPVPGQPMPVDPRSICFGFGRRICPGLHLADASVFLSCAMTLAVFDISKTVENGKVIEPEIKYTTGTISHPEPFRCSIKARSVQAESLILSADKKGDIEVAHL